MYIFEIHGDPSPQKQTRCKCINNRPKLWDASKKESEYIQWQSKPFAPPVPLTCAIEMSMTFYFPIPKGTSSRLKNAMINRVVLPTKKPDIDNLAYLITNALKKIFYEDDNQICCMKLYKVYGADSKTVVKIREILELAPYGLHESDF